MTCTVYTETKDISFTVLAQLRLRFNSLDQQNSIPCYKRVTRSGDKQRQGNGTKPSIPRIPSARARHSPTSPFKHTHTLITTISASLSLASNPAESCGVVHSGLARVHTQTFRVRGRVAQQELALSCPIRHPVDAHVLTTTFAVLAQR